MTEHLSKEYWEQRYADGTTGWDMGVVAPALKQYFDSIEPKDAAILIPGCGNAWEAKYLVEQGFTNITVIDIAEPPVNHLREALGVDAQQQCNVVLGDFFAHAGKYDYIIEQTFFCAIDPALRPAYVKHMAQLLKPKGELAGLLFKTPFDKPGPPYGGTEAEYREVFAGSLNLIEMISCEHSHPARAGNELFFRAGLLS